MDQLIETSRMGLYKIFDVDGNLVLEGINQTKILDKTVEILLRDGKVKVHHGPGLLWDLDLDRGVIDPMGEYHQHKLPPSYVDKLDDEIKAKLR